MWILVLWIFVLGYWVLLYDTAFSHYQDCNNIFEEKNVYFDEDEKLCRLKN